MSRHAFADWLNEASGDVAAGQSPMMTPDSPPAAGGVDPAMQAAPDAMAMQAAQSDPSAANPPQAQSQQPGDDDLPDVANDPQAPEMPEKVTEQDFEQWKNAFFRESIKGDVNKLVDMVNDVRDMDLEPYPRKFVEDNLQILFLRQNANIAKASGAIRKDIKGNLDQNNPSVSVVNHMMNALGSTPELGNVFVKLKGLLGMKGDLHRKYIGSLLGAVQVGSGGNSEDLIYNEREYSIRISTRFNDRWGRVDIGKWSLKEDDPQRYLSDPEVKRLQEGAPEERDVLRRRVVMESIAEAFKKRSFIVNVVGQDGTVQTLGWDISGSLRNAYTAGKLVVKTVRSEGAEAMIDDSGEIVPYVDIKVKYLKDAEGGVDEDGNPAKEEHDFMERIDGMLFLTAQPNIIKEAASSFTGMVIKDSPYNGNPSDLLTLMRCVPNAPELLLRQC